MAVSIKTHLMLLGLILLLPACNRAPQETEAPVLSPSASVSASPHSASPSPPSTQTPVADAPEAENQLISPKGIGSAQLGMTFSALKQRLGSQVEYTVQAPFIVDFDAIAVRKNGEVQFYILYLAGQSFTDNDVIQGLLTNNPAFQTAEQVGPGTSIEDAEAAYGKATLSYNTENESREYARFAKQPAGNLSFSTGNGNTETAGIYPSSTGGYNETQQVRPGAEIESILVVCLTEDCVPTSN